MTGGCDTCDGYGVTAEQREGDKYFSSCKDCSPELPQERVRAIRDEHWRDIPVVAES